MDKNSNITTTAGEVFTYREHAELAHRIWVRWGKDYPAATVAWRRLFQNSCPEEQFREMVADAQKVPCPTCLKHSTQGFSFHTEKSPLNGLPTVLVQPDLTVPRTAEGRPLMQVYLEAQPRNILVYRPHGDE